MNAFAKKLTRSGDKSSINLAGFIDNCGINLNKLLLGVVIKHIVVFEARNNGGE